MFAYPISRILVYLFITSIDGIQGDWDLDQGAGFGSRDDFVVYSHIMEDGFSLVIVLA